jgi:hypothetical protein
MCLLASIAVAQEQTPEMLMFPMGIPCTPPVPDLYDNFENNMGELPMLRGRAKVMSVRGTEYPVTMEMFVNPDTRDFTIIVLFDDDEMACILTVGKELIPFIQGDQI